MDIDELRRTLECWNISPETESEFQKNLETLTLYYRGFKGTFGHWPGSKEVAPPEYSPDECKAYETLTTDKRFLPFIRREYYRSFIPAKTILDCTKSEAIPHHIWEVIIEKQTGGTLRLSEVPAVSSERTKRMIASLNSPPRNGIARSQDYSGHRTGFDYICGYFQRIDRTLGEDTLSGLLEHGMLGKP